MSGPVSHPKTPMKSIGKTSSLDTSCFRTIKDILLAVRKFSERKTLSHNAKIR